MFPFPACLLSVELKGGGLPERGARIHGAWKSQTISRHKKPREALRPPAVNI